MRTVPCNVALLLGAALFTQCSSEVPDTPGSRDRVEGSISSTDTRSADASLRRTLANLPTPLVFDREARLAFAARPSDPIFNFYAAGTIDMMVCPSSLPAEASDEDGIPLQCLLACSDGEHSTRYALYLLEELDGFGFWNGTDLHRIEYPLQPDFWLHLTVVFDRGWLTVAVDGLPIAVLRASIGRPVDPADPSGRKLAFCTTHVGSNANGSDAFLGRIAWLRTWRAPLSVDDVADLPVSIGVPVDPVLAQCFAACSDFGGGDPQMTTASIELRAQQAELARAAKLEASFFKNIDWLFDLEVAKARAVERDQWILAWTTRGDAYDASTLTIERGPLAADAFAGIDARFVPLLLVGDTRNRAPAGIPVGQGALLDASGAVLRIFDHWDAEFIDALAARAKEVAKAPGAEQPAGELLLRPTASFTDADLAKLSEIEQSDGSSEEVRLRIEHARLVAEMVALQQRFLDSKPVTPEGGSPLPFEEAGWLYASEAVRLFERAVLPLEPQAGLEGFAELLCRGLVEDPRYDLIADVANFVVPMRLLSPVVDAAVVANPLPDYSAEESTEEGGGR